ncbi:hypothetical protein L1049_023440 [Liquidambar formosana]
MSVSPTYSAPNLFCGEAANEVIYSGAGTIDDDSASILDDDDEESSIVGIFDSEIDQILGPDLLLQFRKLPVIVAARQEAISWMFKVHAYYNFRPETAYLSVNYLNRFLLSHTLPEGKGWPLQLLSVACLSLAAKMEETIVPLLLDLQVMKPRFMFKPKTVQRMELLVMANLKWRLRIVTPFDFVNYFIAKLPCSSLDHSGLVFSRASDLILGTCRVIDFLEYPPSIMAAAAVLWVTRKNVDHQKLVCFYKRMSQDLVKRCLHSIEQNICRLSSHMIKQEQVPPSLVGVLDAASGQSCHARKAGEW